VREQVVRFGPLEEKVEFAGWYPDDDSDSIHSGADLLRSDEIYKRLREACAERVRILRKTLGLTQEQAGRLIGGGPRAFQKYERGTISPSYAAIGLLEVLARHPEAVRTLETVRAGTHADVEVAQEYDQERSFGGP
jgi:HTH-type transcriptional regulator / antitoxin MqsA